MPDVETLISSVRAEADALEGRRAELHRRRQEIDRELDAVDRQNADVSAALRVLQRHAAGPGSSSSDGPVADPPPLADRVLGVIVEAGVGSRALLMRRFRGSDATPDAVDSAIRRLVDRRAVRREGRRLFAVSGTSAPAPADSDQAAGSGDSDGGGSADRVPLLSVQGGENSDMAEPQPLTVRVLEAVATGTACTRRDLLRHFGSQGVGESSVDGALYGLRTRGKLERRPGGVYAVVEEHSESDSADSGVQDS